MLNFKYAIIPSLTLKELPKISMEQLLEEKKFKNNQWTLQSLALELHFLALKLKKCIIFYICFLMSCKCYNEKRRKFRD